MNISDSVRRYFKKNAIKYSVVSHDATATLEEAADAVGAPYSNMMRAVVLTDGEKHYMSILPVTHVLDFKTLKQDLGSEMQVARYHTFADKFNCCSHGCIPPVGSVFEMTVLVDSSIADLEEVFFEAGSHTDVVKMSGRQYMSLLEGANFGHYA